MGSNPGRDRGAFDLEQDTLTSFSPSWILNTGTCYVQCMVFDQSHSAVYSQELKTFN